VLHTHTSCTSRCFFVHYWVHKNDVFLFIWNRISSCVTEWGSACDLNAPTSFILIKRLKNTAIQLDSYCDTVTFQYNPNPLSNFHRDNRDHSAQQTLVRVMRRPRMDVTMIMPTSQNEICWDQNRTWQIKPVKFNIQSVSWILTAKMQNTRDQVSLSWHNNHALKNLI